MELLKKYIREMISESLVTLIGKDNNQELFDVDFDDKGNIISGKRVTHKMPDLKDAFEIAAQYTDAPKHEIYQKLTSLGISRILRRTAKSPEHVVNVMNKDGWKDTLSSWNPSHKKGRGEIQLKLAFQEGRNKKEPDFQSLDGINLSVKYFGTDGNDTAETGEGAALSAELYPIAEELYNLLEMSLSNKTLTSVDLETRLLELRESRDADEFLTLLLSCEETIKKLKAVILFEHEAKAIIGCDDAHGFYLINQIDQIEIRSLRSKRAEIFGPYIGPGGTTFERAVHDVMDSALQKRTSSKRPKSQQRTLVPVSKEPLNRRKVKI